MIEIKMNEKNKLILVIIFLGIACLLNFFSSNYIAYVYETGIDYDDFILKTIDGNYDWMMKFAEMVIFISVISFIYIIIKNPKNATKWLFMIAIFQLIRAILIPLTLLDPLSPAGFFRNFTAFSNGLFPSGHTSLPFFFFLFTYKKYKLWIFYLITTIIVILSLLMAKQHYTIDIIATLFICYSIKCFTEKNIFK